MQIETTNTFLRPIDGNDRDFFCSLYTNSKLMRLLDFQLSANESQKAFERTLKTMNQTNPSYLLLIAHLRKTGQPLGVMGLSQISYQTQSAEIGIILSREAQGKNYPFELTEATISYCFTTLNITRLTTKFHKKNIPILKLVQKLGFNNISDPKQKFELKYELTP